MTRRPVNSRVFRRTCLISVGKLAVVKTALSNNARRGISWLVEVVGCLAHTALAALKGYIKGHRARVDGDGELLSWGADLQQK